MDSMKAQPEEVINHPGFWTLTLSPPEHTSCVFWHICNSLLFLKRKLFKYCCCMMGNSRIKYLKLKGEGEEEGVSRRTQEERILEDK